MNTSMNTSNFSAASTDTSNTSAKPKTMTKLAQAEQKTTSFTVRTGGRKMTYSFRPRKSISMLLKFLIGIFGGQVLIWPGMAAAQGLAPNALPTGGSVVAGQAGVNTVGNNMTVNQTTSRVILNWSRLIKSPHKHRAKFLAASPPTAKFGCKTQAACISAKMPPSMWAACSPPRSRSMNRNS
jgi:hypothetical protein